MHFPQHLPDETLYSYLGRTARINSFWDEIFFCEWLTGNKTSSVVTARMNPASLADRFEGCLGDAHQITRDTTYFYVAANLGEIDFEHIKQLESGQGSFDLSGTDYGGLSLWRACENCIQEDIENYGVSYWRRACQIPTSSMCLTHACVLRQFDLKRNATHDRFILPSDSNLELLNQTEVIHFEDCDIAMGMTKLGLDALNDFECNASKLNAESAFKAGLGNKGLLTRGGNLKRDEYITLIESSKSFQLLRRFIKFRRREMKPIDLIHDFWSRRPVWFPLFRMIYVCWLFESWHAYRQRCNWESMFSHCDQVGINKQHKAHSSEFLDALEMHRQNCLSQLDEKFDISRSDLRRAFQTSTKWLTRNDLTWLEEKIPLRAKGSSQKKLFE